VYTLGEHLIIEDEVIGILQQRQFGKHLAAEGAISGVVFGKLHAQKKIFKGSEQPVGDVFVNWHAAAQCGPAVQ